MTYEEQLLTDEWYELRDRIIERDNHQCQLCMRNEFLRVHHKQYISGKKAWEYPDNYLITLCGFCHAKFHDKEAIPVLSKPHFHNVDILAIAERCSKSVQAVSILRQRELNEFIRKCQSKKTPDGETIH